MASSVTTPPPYVLHIDPADALQLVTSGASLFILDMPSGSILGFDLQTLTIGPLFKGIKMIPPGPHFVYYSASGKHGNTQSFFTGFFIHPAPGDVIVRKWDPQSEMLVRLSDPDEEERFQIAVRKLEFDRNLGAYDIHHYQTWRRLTAHIVPKVIEKFEPVHGDISVIHEAEFSDKHAQTVAEKRLQLYLKESRKLFQNREGVTEHSRVPSHNDIDVEKQKSSEKAGEVMAMDVDNGVHSTIDGKAHKDASGRCFYTPVDHLIKRSGITSTQLTMLNVDKSSELERLLDQQYKGSEDMLLGEIEFSFIGFLMGQSLESFSQWKSIVCLMLSCDHAPLASRTRLFVKFLDVVCFQLHIGLKSKSPDEEVPFLDPNWFSDDNFLRISFREFYKLVTEAQPVDGELLKQARRLKGILESSLGWTLEFEGEDDEYSPVIVPLTNSVT